MSSKSKYTVVIPVFNEEKRIEGALRAVTGKADVLIVDNYSTDQTITLAKKFDVKILQIKNRGYFTKEWYADVFRAVETDYILFLNLAHVHPPALLDLYERIASAGQFKVVAMYLAAHCYGKRVNAWTHPFAKTKVLSFTFFDKNTVDINQGRIHNEYPYVGAKDQIYYPPRRLCFCVHAFRDDNAETSDQKHTRYASVDALSRFERGERTSWLKIMAVFVWQFWLCFIWRGSIWQGVPGLITSIWFSSYLGNVQIRIWELQKDYSREKIVALHDGLKEQLVVGEKDAKFR